MPSPQKKIIVVGGGYTGLAAAYDIARAGHNVVVYESEDDLGGLAGTFEVSPGHRLEKFYHHWFTSDSDILDLITELGLASRLSFSHTNTGLYYSNSIFRLASPLDLLRFTPIPLIDRIRTGLMALKARRIADWTSLEDQTAEEWIIRQGGRKGFEAIWRPLLQGKFGSEASNLSAVWFWNKLKLRGSSRNRRGKERLVYLDGGFSTFAGALRASLGSAGVQFHTTSAVRRILDEKGVCSGVETAAGSVAADAVLVTTPLPVFLEMTPTLPREYRERCAQIRFLGSVCLVLRLSRSLSSTYWLNVADPSFPFVGVIEHTNLDDTARYGGEHIAYLSKYLPTSDERYRMTDDQVFNYSVPYLQRIFPKFSPEWVVGFKVWRAPYSQPLITRNYSKLLPPMQTPLKNLWLSTMAQIYPEDRGTNYAVRYGRMAARKILESYK